MAEAAESAVVETPAFEPGPGIVVVDQSNFNAWADEKIGITARTDVVEDEPVVDPEAVAAEELKKVEAEKALRLAEESAPKEGDEDGNKVYFKGKWTGKNDFAYRLHVKTEEVRKEESAKVATAAAEAKAAREKADAAEKAAAELRAKYEPPKSEELGPKPTPSQFVQDGAFDQAKYEEAIEAWTADKVEREIATKAEAKRKEAEAASVTKGWNERQTAAKAELPDYEAKIATSDVKVSDQLRDAIVESEYGPKILYHLAENPDIAAELGQMSVRKMLVEFGKLEAQMWSAAKPQTKSEAKVPVAEISRAPAPITPLKTNGNQGAGWDKRDASGNWTGSFEEFQAADRAGKFK